MTTITLTNEQAKQIAAIHHAAAKASDGRASIQQMRLRFTPGHLDAMATNAYMAAWRTVDVEHDITHDVVVDAKDLALKLTAATKAGTAVDLMLDEERLTVATTVSNAWLGFYGGDFPTIDRIIADHAIVDGPFNGTLPAFDAGYFALLAKSTGATPSRMGAFVLHPTVKVNDGDASPLRLTVAKDDGWGGLLMHVRV